MKKLLVLIGFTSTLLCSAQGYVPTDPKERLKTYQQFMGNCRDAMKHGQYSQAHSQAKYCKKLEPDSATPYRLCAICDYYSTNGNPEAMEDINMYFNLTHKQDTFLLKIRAISYMLKHERKAGQCPECYDSAEKDFDEFINVYHCTRYLHYRALLNRSAHNWAVKDTMYLNRESRDDSAYVKIYGKDAFYNIQIKQ